MTGLARFVTAQDGGVYTQALGELRAGQKRSHWMWFVFPQIAGLGRSATAQFYAIADRAEAQSYLAHPLLGARLDETTRTMIEWSGRRSAEAILGSIDAAKFKSSMTLFEVVAASGCAFTRALSEFFAGERDPATLARL